MTDRMVRVDLTVDEARALLRVARAAEEGGWDEQVGPLGGDLFETYDQMQAAERAIAKLDLLTAPAPQPNGARS